RDEMGVESIRLGESWRNGSVVLSWQSVRQGSRNPEDGRNVVLHEFAHQLDQFDGRADGLPVLKSRGHYPEWAEAMQASYQKLRARVERGARTVLDDYGATNPAEFFAVATETFFEKPRQLMREHQGLYEQLKRFYGLDPLEWE
ncbi:MAG: zinc-dependent peptidase, partial [Roseibacillus sp.]|nr:zinc-dependent peptidase [Roseibacillus sp.]